MAPPDCRAVHPRKVFNISVIYFGLNFSSTQPSSTTDLAIKTAVASDPHPFAICAPSTERSVYVPSTPAMMCHIVHVKPQACSGPSASRQQCGGDS
eukprot:357856-Chlamydomonas_euryale.AAC.3